MRKAALGVLIVSGALLQGQWREVKPEEEPALFRSDVNLVRVDVEVLNGGRAVLGLAQTDFQVYDNGSLRQLTGFSSEQAPLDLLLVFDVSGSMRPVVEKVAESAQQALAQLREGDRVGVMVFTTRTQLVQPFTADIDKVLDAIDTRVLTQPFNGGTYLLDALADGALEFMREKPGERRRAVVVITDNKGQRTRSEDSVVRMMWEADATATGLIVESPDQQTGVWTRPRSRRGVIWAPTGPAMTSMMSVGMNKVAEQTGGDVLATDNPGPAFAEVIKRIRSRYSLYYSMPEGTPGERRDIKVQLTSTAAGKNFGAAVKARKGYVIPSPGGAGSSRLTGAPR